MSPELKLMWITYGWQELMYVFYCVFVDTAKHMATAVIVPLHAPIAQYAIQAQPGLLILSVLVTSLKRHNRCADFDRYFVNYYLIK